MNRTTIDRKSLLPLLAGGAAVALFLAAPLVAQPDGGAGHGPGPGHHAGAHHPGGGRHGFLGERALERLAEHLDLTEAQRQEAAALHESARATLEPIREESRQLRRDLRELLDQPSADAAAVGALVLALDARRDRVRQLFEETHAAFVALLTPEQAALLEEHRRHRRHGDRGDEAEGAEGVGDPL